MRIDYTATESVDALVVVAELRGKQPDLRTVPGAHAEAVRIDEAVRNVGVRGCRFGDHAGPEILVDAGVLNLGLAVRHQVDARGLILNDVGIDDRKVDAAA